MKSLKFISPSFALSSIFIALTVFAAIFAESLIPYSIFQGELSESLCSPSWKHLLGCDAYGVDVLSSVIMGARISIFVSLVVVTLSTVLGCFFGSLAAILGGWFDAFFLQFTESFMALPAVLIFICLGSVIQMNAFSLIMAMSLTGWMGTARLVRAKLLECREYDYILSARALGVKPFRLATHYLLPNLYSPLLVTCVFGVSGVILTESTLSFLGLGIQDSPSWGLLIHQGRSVLLEAPHISLFPGACVFFLILSLNVLGDSLDKK